MDSADLTAVVRSILRDQTASVVEVECRRFTAMAINPVSAGVFLVSGTAQTQDGIRPWNAVVKGVQRPANSFRGRALPPGWGQSDKSHPFHWMREVHAYQSGLLHLLPQGIGVPECFLVQRDPHRPILWLWLEKVIGESGAGWAPDEYAVAARHLGHLSAANLGLVDTRCYPWLSRDLVRVWLNDVLPDMQEILDTAPPAHLGFNTVFSPDVRRVLRRLWVSKRSSGLLDRLDALPATLSHLEAYGNNLFLKPNPEGGSGLMAIDWAQAGVAPIGQEAGHLVGLSLVYCDVDPLRARELCSTAFESFVAGLEDLGCRNLADEARLGFAASAAYRMLRIAHFALDPAQWQWAQKSLGHSAENLLRRWRVAVQLQVELAEEVLAG